MFGLGKRLFSFEMAILHKNKQISPASKAMNNDNPLVSIITPSFNQGRFIEETILSVKGQDYGNIEHIIIDGGSSDETLDILRKYETEYGLTWISEPDRGQSDAINKGFNLAKGSVVGWINSDDTYLPGAVSNAVKVLTARKGIDWIHGNAYWIDADGFVIGQFPVKAFNLEDLLKFGMHIAQPSIFFRRYILEKIGGLDENLHSTMDYDFMLRMSHTFQGGFIPEFMATRRLHKFAKSVSQANTFYKETIKSLVKFFSENELSLKVLRLKHLAFQHANLVGGYQAFVDRDFKSARQLLFKAIYLDPRPWKKETIASLVLIVESILGVDWIKPGFSRMTKNDYYGSRQGIKNLNWKKGQD